MSVICRLNRLAMPYFTGKFEWPTFSTFWVIVAKLILRCHWSDFWARTAVLGKVNFSKIALIISFMYRFQNGLLIPRGHVTTEISHYSDTDILKFHSRLFCVIGFFGAHLKSSSFVRDFFYYFSRVADRLISLRREFRFFPTTLGFLDFWGSVGTICFFSVVPELRGKVCFHSYHW